MHEVTTSVVSPDQLRPLIGSKRLQRLQELATRTKDKLDGCKVWNVNSTAAGGGVAEMLHGLVAYARGAGVDTRWLVTAGDPAFFALTKRVHNGLHGSPGDGGALGEEERRHYDEISAREGAALLEYISPGDVVILHDPQTLGLIRPAVEAGAEVIWRCHIGTEVANEHATRAWEFLRPYIEQAPMSVYSRPGYVPSYVDVSKTVVIPPAIDPHSAKNEDLPDETVAAVLRHIGYAASDGASDGAVSWEAPTGQERTVHRRAQVVGEGDPPPLEAPVVVQVSRWDRLKDMQGLLEAFVDELAGEGCHLALVGPSVAEVADDPEGAEVLAECVRAWEALPDTVRRQIRLVTLPMDDGDENAAMVNAIQRHAAVVVQKSLMEGFGLTVAEAMWKSRPVVASAIGGILDQVVDEESGILLQDPCDHAELQTALRRLLESSELADRLGSAARARINHEYLPDRQLRQWMELILR
jgi:trehalose synthase